jgi:hypothetical protein
MVYGLSSVDLDTGEKRTMKTIIILAAVVLWIFLAFICWAIVAGASRYDHDDDYLYDDRQKGEDKWQ